MKQGEKELNEAGLLYVALTKYKKQDPATPSPLSVGTPGDKRSGPVDTRFRDVLERRRAESEGESMDETLSKTGEEMEVRIRLSRKRLRKISPHSNCCRT